VTTLIGRWPRWLGGSVGTSREAVA